MCLQILIFRHIKGVLPFTLPDSRFKILGIRCLSLQNKVEKLFKDLYKESIDQITCHTVDKENTFYYDVDCDSNNDNSDSNSDNNNNNNDNSDSNSNSNDQLKKDIYQCITIWNYLYRNYS